MKMLTFVKSSGSEDASHQKVAEGQNRIAPMYSSTVLREQSKPITISHYLRHLS